MMRAIGRGAMIAGHAMIAWPAAEHRRSRRHDGPLQSRRELEGRRVAAAERTRLSG
jgi:hypothetical protein